MKIRKKFMLGNRGKKGIVIKILGLFLILVLSCAKTYRLPKVSINSEDKTKLKTIYKNNDIEGLRDILESNEEILNYVDESNDASLAHLAVLKEESTILELLIELNAPLNYNSQEMKTSPIGLAIGLKKNTMVGKLIKANADLMNVFDGKTALHFAVYYDNPEAAQLILDTGFDVDTRTKNMHGVTAFHDAALECKPEVAKVLIENGAKVRKRSRLGFSPAGDAAHSGCTPVLEMIDNN